MVKVFNKSNRPIGIAGQSVLPDKEIQVKDKDAYCAVFDENGNNTGKKKILPGLKALEIRGLITISEVEEAKPVEPKEEPKEEVVEEAVEEIAEEKPKKKTTRTRAKKTEEPAE